MGYVTDSETLIRYPVIDTWADSGTSQVNSDLLYYSETELNSRLSVAYTVPFGDPAPPTVKDLTMDIAYLRLLRTRDRKLAKTFSEYLNDRIKDVISGDEPIYTGSGTVIESTGTGQDIWSSNEDYAPTHSMRGAENDVVDPDRLRDEQTERD